ncbi:hypothetical protein ACFL96_08465 [Thermoproteota archaeon]
MSDETLHMERLAEAHVNDNPNDPRAWQVYHRAKSDKQKGKSSWEIKFIPPTYAQKPFAPVKKTLDDVLKDLEITQGDIKKVHDNHFLRVEKGNPKNFKDIAGEPLCVYTPDVTSEDQVLSPLEEQTHYLRFKVIGSGGIGPISLYRIDCFGREVLHIIETENIATAVSQIPLTSIEMFLQNKLELLPEELIGFNRYGCVKVNDVNTASLDEIGRKIGRRSLERKFDEHDGLYQTTGLMHDRPDMERFFMYKKEITGQTIAIVKVNDGGNSRAYIALNNPTQQFLIDEMGLCIDEVAELKEKGVLKPHPLNAKHEDYSWKFDNNLILHPGMVGFTESLELLPDEFRPDNDVCERGYKFRSITIGNERICAFNFPHMVVDTKEVFPNYAPGQGTDHLKTVFVYKQD